METTDEVRREAVAYVEAVVARAEGAPLPEKPVFATRPRAGRLVPGSVKRLLIRFLIKLNRHPFDHLSHPLRVEIEHQFAELRASVHAANRRADQAYGALQRLRPELEQSRRLVSELERQVRELRARLDRPNSAG